MGSFRRGLIPALCLPGTAWAEVCAQARPGWDPASGPTGAATEALGHLASGPGLVLIAILVLGFLTRRPLVSVCAGLLAACFALILYAEDINAASVLSQGQAEGCIGPATLTYAAFACIIVAALLSATLRRPRA